MAAAGPAEKGPGLSLCLDEDKQRIVTTFSFLPGLCEVWQARP